MSRRRSRDLPASAAAPPQSGTLYVVATPIGNLEDITLRALRILKEAAFIASEDTRHTRKLLTHYGIKTPLISYYREREAERAGQILEKLRFGQDVALVSDAGTPGISDPGCHLVRSAYEARIAVEPIPGPSALAAAISIAPLALPTFLFLGFPPARRQERCAFWGDLAREQRPLLFFEAPHRLVRSLADCLEILGDRQTFLVRELTKTYEEAISGTLSEVLADLEGRSAIKGELVVMIAGAAPAPAASVEEVRGMLRCLHDRGITLRAAVDEVAGETKSPRSPVYREALAVWGKTRPSR